MILVWGTATDPPTAAILTALARGGAATFCLDESRMRAAEFEASPRDGDLGGIVHTELGTLDLAAVTGAYIRPSDSGRVLALAGATDEQRRRIAELEAALLTWSDAADARIVNRPAAMASNNSKPYQAGLIAALGFHVPECLITSDAEALRDFHARHGSLIYKSSSGVRSIVARHDPLDTARQVDRAACPTMFQRWIPGTDVRVHVVGDRLFATEVLSSATDYRYPVHESERPTLRACTLPDDIARSCVALAAGLGLAFAGIDLRRSNDGRFVCFEANPSPGFTYYEDATGLPIAEAVASLLAGTDR